LAVQRAADGAHELAATKPMLQASKTPLTAFQPTGQNECVATTTLPYSVFEAFCMAVERVERLLVLITQALNQARVPYAVIGGNAVGAWVATRDPDAVRNTKDVDLLVNRSDLAALDAGVAPVGYYLDTVGDVFVLLERAKPSPKLGVHLIFAGERVRATDVVPAPRLEQVVEFPQGFRVVEVPSLLTMKLTAFRKHDQVHIEDMIRVGLITPEVRAAVPAELLPRLEEIERTMPE
jgi:hypothetical protein